MESRRISKQDEQTIHGYILYKYKNIEITGKSDIILF